ncbi:GntR family transcriptional regulator [Paenibacillus elgii]|uniref:GntR family transcriptional regulator n=1 Tax=Paenibacillus elgii TaxID=189691 RepID=UPI002D7A6B85|nr:GntR family transcriptional regulator [Paenibacillus elgii]
MKDHVYNYIAEEIQNGSLLPNQKVNEAIICEKLGVSRTPVREALIQLASENLLENIPRRGFIVKEIDTKKKLDVFQIVAVLDALAASLSVDFLTDEDIARMTRLTDQIDIAIQQHNFSDYQARQNEFHQVYLLRCNNSTLIDMLNSLQHSFVRQIYLSNDKEKLFAVLAQMNAEHRQIIQYFKAKDAQGVEAFIKNVHWKINYTDMI